MYNVHSYYECKKYSFFYIFNPGHTFLRKCYPTSFKGIRVETIPEKIIKNKIRLGLYILNYYKH